MRIAIFGGSFNPPGLHHLRIAEALAARFDQVLLIPCGPRPDKPVVRGTPPVFRAAMAHLAFKSLPKVKVELFDLEEDTFTRSWQLEARFGRLGELWHVVGADLVKGGALGLAQIQTSWENGPGLWRNSRFLVMTRPGYPLAPEDCPPHHEIMELEIQASSTDIRRRIRHGETVDTLVDDEISAYIERYGLYREAIPNNVSRGRLDTVRCLIFKDSRNALACQLADKYAAYEDGGEANCILALGGDGTMLRAIREHWEKRLPFFGINAGHVGFLMNDGKEVERSGFPPGDLMFRQLPLLYVEMELASGEVIVTRAFNDAWVERETSQSAWLEVSVNGEIRLPKLISDGALVSTAAGSTAYARSMGATPLLADTPAWLLVGSNVLEPIAWKSAILSVESQVEIRSLDPVKRPIRACVDGHMQGTVVRLRARLSRVAAAELAFYAHHDMAEKIARVQFSG